MDRIILIRLINHEDQEVLYTFEEIHQDFGAILFQACPNIAPHHFYPDHSGTVPLKPHDPMRLLMDIYFALTAYKSRPKIAV